MYVCPIFEGGMIPDHARSSHSVIQARHMGRGVELDLLVVKSTVHNIDKSQTERAMHAVHRCCSEY